MRLVQVSNSQSLGCRPVWDIDCQMVPVVITGYCQSDKVNLRLIHIRLITNYCNSVFSYLLMCIHMYGYVQCVSVVHALLVCSMTPNTKNGCLRSLVSYLSLSLFLHSNLLQWILVPYDLYSRPLISPLYPSHRVIYDVKQTTSFHTSGEL